MPEIQQFVERHFLWFFLFCAAWVTLSFARRYYRYKRHGVSFPDIATQSVRFNEKAASGCSLKSLWTRLGGARNCLSVTVTDSEVWIRPFFPFIALAEDFDLVHRIARSSITSVRPNESAFASTLTLEYRDVHGAPHRLLLRLRDPSGFIGAVQSGAPRVERPA